MLVMCYVGWYMSSLSVSHINFNVNSCHNVVKSVHSDYGITNVEWVLVNNLGLSVYLDSLCIEVGDGSNAGIGQCLAMLKYKGVCGDFYLRTVYRHLYVGGGHLCNLDPWNREFPMFPERSNMLLHCKLKRSSGYMASLYEYECFHSSLWGGAADMYNVIVLSTSVCGVSVYCVDVLS